MKVLENLKSKNALNEVLIANITKENIDVVMAIEKTAVAVSPEKIKNCKTIVCICSGTVVFVANITNIEQYNANQYSRLWGTNKWRALISFDNVIYIGDKIENVFSASNIKNTQTISYLKTLKDRDELITSTEKFHLFHTKNYLSLIGIS